VLTDGSTYETHLDSGSVESRHLNSMGGWKPGLNPTIMANVGKKASGRLLDGREWSQYSRRWQEQRQSSRRWRLSSWSYWNWEETAMGKFEESEERAFEREQLLRFYGPTEKKLLELEGELADEKRKRERAEERLRYLIDSVLGLMRYSRLLPPETVDIEGPQFVISQVRKFRRYQGLWMEGDLSPYDEVDKILFRAFHSFSSLAEIVQKSGQHVINIRASMGFGDQKIGGSYCIGRHELEFAPHGEWIPPFEETMIADRLAQAILDELRRVRP